MPIIKSAKKAARQADKRTAHNQQIKKDIKAALKAFRENPTPENLAKAQSEYDKATKKDLMKKNTASRKKMKLYKIAKASGVKLGKVAKKSEKTEAKTVAKKAAKETTQSKAKADKK